MKVANVAPDGHLVDGDVLVVVLIHDPQALTLRAIHAAITCPRCRPTFEDVADAVERMTANQTLAKSKARYALGPRGRRVIGGERGE